MALLRPQWLDNAGGLGYHLGALFRQRNWAPFSAQVAGWLGAWSPGRQTLVLVGPSGGYTIPPGFLAQFEQIVVLEPDPLARRILARRFPQSPFRFDTLDCLHLPHGPAALAERYRAAAILFTNLLGQVCDAQDVPPLAETLRAALQEHPWGSYHDVLSAPARPVTPIPATLPQSLTAEALARQMWQGQPIPVTDHGTLGWVGSPGQLGLWALHPGAYHLVEWACHTPRAPTAEG